MLDTSGDALGRDDVRAPAALLTERILERRGVAVRVGEDPDALHAEAPEARHDHLLDEAEPERVGGEQSDVENALFTV